ncbi:hypothetical protein [Streptomyces sp. NPDC093269]|uniref:hypothetical protein n=1 Tax=Streptomyces sp. NPDC093269 TaxID=3366038 RepID=UPI003805EC17
MTITIAPTSYPRPQLVHDHARLFVEPNYPDGQPYAAEDDDSEDDDSPATITA